ncbi:uncharacterized protein LOC144328093 [Podarcis muralis]
MAPKKASARPGMSSTAKRPIRGPSQALRSPASSQPVGRVQSLVASMAGDPAALSRFAAQMDGFLQQCSSQPSTSAGPPRPVGASSPSVSSSSEDGREELSAGGGVNDSQLTQPHYLPAVHGRGRRSRLSSRRASGGRAPLLPSSRRGGNVTPSVEAPTTSGRARVVSSSSAPGPSRPNGDSESSAEDSLPVPARKSSGGKRHRRRSSRRRAKRRKDDSSTSYTGSTDVRIWLVGHSIIHWACVAARQSGLGPGLGLPRHVHLSWLSRRGMRWSELLPMIRRQLQLEGPPSAIVVQLGENDLVFSDCFSLRAAILADLEELQALVPTAKLFWSRWLQRRAWRGSHCPAATERARRRINSAVSLRILEMGGDVIFHPEISSQEPSFFRVDGVHLSASGNEAWIGAVVSKLRSWLGL